MVDLQGNCALKACLFLSLDRAFSRVYQRIQWGYAFAIILQARTVIQLRSASTEAAMMSHSGTQRVREKRNALLC